MSYTDEIKNKINTWLSPDYQSEEQEKLKELLENNEEEKLIDAFYKDLEFGTGGMRGKMGPGTNRINRFTLGMATQGYATYLLKKYPDQKIRVAISHDNRLNSRTYAENAAQILSSNDIKVYLCEDLRPTPELSYAIRYYKCHGGIMLTASHNPREYNGFKAYGIDGGQLVAPDDKAVMDEVKNIADISEVNFSGNDDLIEIVGENLDNAYLDAIHQKSLSPEAIQSHSDLTIVYSPIHGTGAVIMQKAMNRFGFTNVHTVTDQMTIDGNFPTVIFPNPEEEEAMKMALELGEKIDADIIMATDPDADRVGIAAPNLLGKYELLNGNQMASLLTYYLLIRLKELNRLKDDMFVVNTIVTSNLIDKLCADYNVDCYATLTGFKHIGKLITDLEGKKKFIGGGEESYGYLVGDLVRDKDAIISACFIAEMTAYFADKGMSLYEAMIEMYKNHGLYRERLISIVKEGRKGAEEIKQMLESLRKNPPKDLAGAKVVRVKDYLSSEDRELDSGRVEKLNLPTSNVLQFITDNDDIVSARPSGTEPKIKFYISVNSKLHSSSDYVEQVKELEQKIDDIENDLMNF